jgi:tRNA threonylcarbamoyladenosine biosynthesis protein TsaE
MMTTVADVRELKSFLKDHIVSILKPKTILLLMGDLGVGKTQTVKLLVELLGGKEVSSPTFSIVQNYDVKNGIVYHCDLFRIESVKDLEFTGFWDLFNEPNAMVFVEWPEKMKTYDVAGWSVYSLLLEFDEKKETARKITLRQLS